MKVAMSTEIAPDRTLEECARMAVEAGYDGLEIVVTPPYADLADLERDCGAVRETLLRYGLEAACVTSLWYVDGSGVTEDAVRRVIELSARLRSPIVKVAPTRKPSAQATDSDFARCAASLKRCAVTAQECGVVLTVENQLGMLAERVGGQDRLLDEAASPRVGAALNPANAFAVDEDPVDSVDILADRLYLVRVKDARSGADHPTWTPTMTGLVDLASVFLRLKDIGYGGYIVAECPLASEWFEADEELRTPEAFARHERDRIHELLSIAY